MLTIPFSDGLCQTGRSENKDIENRKEKKMKKTLMYTLLLALTPAVFAAEPSFKDMKKLEAVNG